MTEFENGEEAYHKTKETPVVIVSKGEPNQYGDVYIVKCPDKNGTFEASEKSLEKR